MTVYDETVALLNTLAEYQEAKNLSNKAKEDLINSLLSDEIKAKIAEIEAEFASNNQLIDGRITTLANQIDEAVLALECTVKGDKLMAIYNNGRVTWSTKDLDVAMKFYPAIAEFRKVGNPYVSIREVSK